MWVFFQTLGSTPTVRFMRRYVNTREYILLTPKIIKPVIQPAGCFQASPLGVGYHRAHTHLNTWGHEKPQPIHPDIHAP